MNDNLNGKTIPWSQFEEYIEYHKSTIEAFVGQLKYKTFTKQQIEGFLPASFLKLHAHITSILESIGIHIAVKEDPKLQNIVNAVMKLQNSFIQANKKNKSVSV